MSIISQTHNISSIVEDDGEKRRCVEVASVTEQQSATRGQLSGDMTIVEHNSDAQNNTLSDDTILAVNDYVTVVTMDVVTTVPTIMANN